MADLQFCIHLQGGKSHVDPVQICDNIQHEHEGKQAECHPPDSPFLEEGGWLFTRTVFQNGFLRTHGFNLAGEQGFEP